MVRDAPELSQLLSASLPFAPSIKLTHNLPAFLPDRGNAHRSEKPAAAPHYSSMPGATRVQASRLMQEFVLGQKWIMTDPLFGTFVGEVVDVSEDSGTVAIIDDQGNEVDVFTGTAAEFQASGEWRLMETKQ